MTYGNTYIVIYCCVISGVESLFNKAGCDSTAITELLGGHAGVTDSNILQYMGIIEQRCNELLHLQSFIQAKVTKVTTHSNIINDSYYRNLITLMQSRTSLQLIYHHLVWSLSVFYHLLHCKFFSVWRGMYVLKKLCMVVRIMEVWIWQYWHNQTHEQPYTFYFLTDASSQA